MLMITFLSLPLWSNTFMMDSGHLLVRDHDYLRNYHRYLSHVFSGLNCGGEFTCQVM